MQVPVILYTWREQTDITYYYPRQLITLEHLLYISSQLPNTPFQGSGYKTNEPEYGTGEYVWNQIPYYYWWAAGIQPKADRCPQHIRIVFATLPKQSLPIGATVHCPQLWHINNNTPDEQLYISLVAEKIPEPTPMPMPTPTSPTQSPISTQSPPAPVAQLSPVAQPPLSAQPPPPPTPVAQPSPVAQPPLSVQPPFFSQSQLSTPQPLSVSPQPPAPTFAPVQPPSSAQSIRHFNLAFSNIKQKAADMGRNLFYVAMAMVGIVGLILLVYALPIAGDVLNRCPILKTSSAYASISKSEENFDCPFATPVYDADFNKIGTVHNQTPKTVQVMFLPEYRGQTKNFNVAYYHQEPRKVVAILRVLGHSIDSEQLQAQLLDVQKSLQPHYQAIFKRVLEIIKENYPPEKQEELCKALLDSQLAPFIIAPITKQFDKFKDDLKKYQWSKAVTLERVRPVKDSVVNAYGRQAVTEDVCDIGVGMLLKTFTSGLFSSNWSNLGEAVEETAVKRVEKFAQNEQVQQAVAKSSYQVAMQVGNEIGVMKNDDVFEGEYYAALKGDYSQRLDFISARLQERGYTLTRREIAQFWELLENDATLTSLYRQAEQIIQDKGGAWLAKWVKQFFPEDPDRADQLQVLATTLMREILYGKAEPIIILDKDPKRTREKLELIKGQWGKKSQAKE